MPRPRSAPSVVSRKGLNTSGFLIFGTPDDLSGGPATGTVTVMSPLVVVEAKIALERGLKLPQLREVVAAEAEAMM